MKYQAGCKLQPGNRQCCSYGVQVPIPRRGKCDRVWLSQSLSMWGPCVPISWVWKVLVLQKVGLYGVNVTIVYPFPGRGRGDGGFMRQTSYEENRIDGSGGFGKSVESRRPPWSEAGWVSTYKMSNCYQEPGIIDRYYSIVRKNSYYAIARLL